MMEESGDDGMKSRVVIPRVIALIVALAAIAGLFLPYVRATEEYSEYLNSISDQKALEPTDLTATDIIELSLFEYAKTYYQGAEEIFHDKAEGIFYAVMFVTPGIFGFFALLCALRRKGIPMMLQALLVGGSIWLINWDVVDRGIMPDYRLVWGITHSMYYPIAVVLFICGAWIFCAKHKAKKECVRQ